MVVKTVTCSCVVASAPRFAQDKVSWAAESVAAMHPRY